MKIKKEKLKQIVREAIYQEATQYLVAEGKIEEFLGGLFGGGPSKTATQKKKDQELNKLSDDELYNKHPDEWLKRSLEKAKNTEQNSPGYYRTNEPKIMAKYEQHPEVKKKRNSGPKLVDRMRSGGRAAPMSYT